jgi:hypothetical protein
MQVKHYVAEVETARGRFRVFKTGDERCYLFDAVDAAGCSTGWQFPVRKDRLRPEVRRALRHGVGLVRPLTREQIVQRLRAQLAELHAQAARVEGTLQELGA